MIIYQLGHVALPAGGPFWAIYQEGILRLSRSVIAGAKSYGAFLLPLRAGPGPVTIFSSRVSQKPRRFLENLALLLPLPQGRVVFASAHFVALSSRSKLSDSQIDGS
jgi:hypothetical protein